MDPTAFVAELATFKAAQLAPLVGAGASSAGEARGADVPSLLKVALVNEINVSELAAAWIPTTREVDVKLAFARQVGDEASHFRLVADRLAALGLDVSAFEAPAESPLFAYMKALPTTVERVAAGLFTLESIAYGVNEAFMSYCARAGDDETVRIYREYIQPDERAHQELGQALLAKYATTPGAQAAARAVVTQVIAMATAGRAKAAASLGTACLPGC